MLINAIAFGVLALGFGGAYIYWMLSENSINRANAERHAQWEREEAAYEARIHLATQREERVPLAERIRGMSFDAGRFGSGHDRLDYVE